MKGSFEKLGRRVKKWFLQLWTWVKNGIFRDKNYWWILLVAGVVLLQFATKNYMNGDDTSYHVANIQAIMEAWKSGHFDLKIFPFIGNNLGYGAGIFYPQLFHVMAAGLGIIFTPFTSNLAWAMKAAHFLGMFLSGVTMYILMKNATRKKNVALITVMIYMMMPYRMVEILIRDAQAEELLFVFLPMVMLGLKNLIEKNYQGFYGWFIVGYAGLVYSHLVMTMFITIMLGVGLLLNWKKFFRKEIFSRFCLATLVTMILCLPFLVPMMEHKFSGTEYRVFSDEVMVTRELLVERAHPLYRLVMWTDDGYTFTRGAINAVVLAVAVLAVVQYKKLKVEGNKFFTVSIVATMMILGMFMYSNLFPWGKLYNLFWSIQYPFRLQVIITFGVSALAGIYLGSVRKTEYPAVKWLFLGSSIMLWTMVLGMKGTEWGKIEELKAGNGVIYDYVWEGYGHQREYLPVKTNEKWVKTRGDEVATKSGDVVAKVVENNTPELMFVASGKGEVELPRIYYLGYKIQNTQNGEVVEYKESEKGMILAEVDEGEYRVSYEGTTAEKVANILAGVTAVGGGVGVVVRKRKNN